VCASACMRCCCCKDNECTAVCICCWGNMCTFSVYVLIRLMIVFLPVHIAVILICVLLSVRGFVV